MKLMLLLLIISPSCRNNIKAPTVDSKLAFDLVEKLVSFGPRFSGSKNIVLTSNFIANKAKEFGADVKIENFKEITPEGNVTFRNIIAEIKGESDKFIIVGSHYDTKKIDSIPDFEGANDSGSSTGLLLAMIKSIKKSKLIPRYSLRFVFFDGEECFLKYTNYDGLYGSRYHLKQMLASGEKKQCKAVIILDMIGDKNLNVTIPNSSDPELAKLLFNSAKTLGVKKYFTWFKGDILDDHTPFVNANIPAIDIIDFEFGPSNIYWHSKADTMDKISPKSLEITGNVTLHMLWNLK